MKKKVFSVLLTVALATGVLAGCGSSAATGNNAATGAAQNEGRQQVQLPQERNPETPS